MIENDDTAGFDDDASGVDDDDDDAGVSGLSLLFGLPLRPCHQPLTHMGEKYKDATNLSQNSRFYC